MKKWMLFLYLMVFFKPLFAQDQTNSSQNAPPSDTKNTVTMDQVLTNSKNSDNIIHIDLKQRELTQKDPYPLSEYQGGLWTDISMIQTHYQLENIQKIKASLETIYQDKDQKMTAAAFLLLGNIYDHLGMYDKSIEMYEQGRKLIPVDSKNKEEKLTVFNLNKSQVYRHWGKAHEALKILDNFSLDIQNKHPEIFLYKGLTMLSLKDKNLTIQNLRKYLEKVPHAKQSRHIRRAIAWLLLMSKNGAGNNSGALGAGMAAMNQTLMQQRQDTERALQTLIDQEYNDNQDRLMDNSKSQVKNNKLDIPVQDIDEGEEFSGIAD